MSRFHSPSQRQRSEHWRHCSHNSHTSAVVRTRTSPRARSLAVGVLTISGASIRPSSSKSTSTLSCSRFHGLCSEYTDVTDEDECVTTRPVGSRCSPTHGHICLYYNTNTANPRLNTTQSSYPTKNQIDTICTVYMLRIEVG